MSDTEGYLGWNGVRKLAKRLGYDWFDVCDILWKTKYHKHPKLKEILLFSVIKKNLINIESNKQVFDLNGNPVFRKQGEQDIHYAIRTDLDLFKENYKIRPLWKESPDIYKSIRQKYKNLYARFAKEINKHAAMMG